MKIRRLLNLFGCWMLCVVLTMGCDKAPVNDTIEGHWRLERFTLLESGKVVECERLFYSIMSTSTRITEKQGPNDYGDFMALTEFRDHETVLALKDFKVLGQAGGDATDEQLLPFGIHNRKETVFRVLEASQKKKKLVLESDYARLELTKF